MVFLHGVIMKILAREKREGVSSLFQRGVLILARRGRGCPP